MFAVRSGKVDDIARSLSRSAEISLHEHAVPNLTDDDIDRLIDGLDRQNRLGILKSAPYGDRRKAFAQRAGRQLLVAMWEATTGKRFEEKIQGELTELEGIQRMVYSLISVASSQRYYLAKDEILVAVGDRRQKQVRGRDPMVSALGEL